MGASPTRIKRIAFGISIATTAVAGALLIIIQPVEPSVGREYIGRVFAICVLGGLGSLPGTVIAAMLLGIIESFTGHLLWPVLGAGGGVRRAAPHPRVPAGGSSRAIGLSIVRTRLLPADLDRSRGWSCSLPRAW
jgi:ABC-type branched-subunit amino acid transport system permease subunit